VEISCLNIRLVVELIMQPIISVLLIILTAGILSSIALMSFLASKLNYFERKLTLYGGRGDYGRIAEVRPTRKL
jgi:hypothetical protein